MLPPLNFKKISKTRHKPPNNMNIHQTDDIYYGKNNNGDEE